jgi:dTMP kinase
MRKNNYPGKYIVFEGIDGSGKDTVIGLVAQHFKEIGTKFIVTIEPNRKSPAGEEITRIMDEKKKTLTPYEIQELHVKARAYGMLAEVIPALGAGVHVLSNRSFISTFAYGMAFGLSFEEVAGLHREHLPNSWLRPDLALLINVPADVAMDRIQKSRTITSYFEAKEKLEKIRAQYLLLAEKGWMTVIDGTLRPEEVARQAIWHITGSLSQVKNP